MISLATGNTDLANLSKMGSQISSYERQLQLSLVLLPSASLELCRTLEHLPNIPNTPKHPQCSLHINGLNYDKIHGAVYDGSKCCAMQQEALWRQVASDIIEHFHRQNEQCNWDDKRCIEAVEWQLNCIIYFEVGVFRSNLKSLDEMYCANVTTSASDSSPNIEFNEHVNREVCETIDLSQEAGNKETSAFVRGEASFATERMRRWQENALLAIEVLRILIHSPTLFNHLATLPSAGGIQELERALKHGEEALRGAILTCIQEMNFWYNRTAEKAVSRTVFRILQSLNFKVEMLQQLHIQQLHLMSSLFVLFMELSWGFDSIFFRPWELLQLQRKKRKEQLREKDIKNMANHSKQFITVVENSCIKMREVLFQPRLLEEFLGTCSSLQQYVNDVRMYKSIFRREEVLDVVGLSVNQCNDIYGIYEHEFTQNNKGNILAMKTEILPVNFEDQQSLLSDETSSFAKVDKIINGNEDGLDDLELKEQIFHYNWLRIQDVSDVAGDVCAWILLVCCCCIVGGYTPITLRLYMVSAVCNKATAFLNALNSVHDRCRQHALLLLLVVLISARSEIRCYFQTLLYGTGVFLHLFRELIKSGQKEETLKMEDDGVSKIYSHRETEYCGELSVPSCFWSNWCAETQTKWLALIGHGGQTRKILLEVVILLFEGNKVNPTSSGQSEKFFSDCWDLVQQLLPDRFLQLAHDSHLFRCNIEEFSLIPLDYTGDPLKYGLNRDLPEQSRSGRNLNSRSHWRLLFCALSAETNSDLEFYNSRFYGELPELNDKEREVLCCLLDEQWKDFKLLRALGGRENLQKERQMPDWRCLLILYSQRSERTQKEYFGRSRPAKRIRSRPLLKDTGLCRVYGHDVVSLSKRLVCTKNRLQKLICPESAEGESQIGCSDYSGLRELKLREAEWMLVDWVEVNRKELLCFEDFGECGAADDRGGVNLSDTNEVVHCSKGDAVYCGASTGRLILLQPAADNAIGDPLHWQQAILCELLIRRGESSTHVRQLLNLWIRLSQRYKLVMVHVMALQSARLKPDAFCMAHVASIRFISSMLHERAACPPSIRCLCVKLIFLHLERLLALHTIKSREIKQTYRCKFSGTLAEGVKRILDAFVTERAHVALMVLVSSFVEDTLTDMRRKEVDRHNLCCLASWNCNLNDCASCSFSRNSLLRRVLMNSTFDVQKDSFTFSISSTRTQDRKGSIDGNTSVNVDTKFVQKNCGDGGRFGSDITIRNFEQQKTMQFIDLVDQKTYANSLLLPPSRTNRRAWTNPGCCGPCKNMIQEKRSSFSYELSVQQKQINNQYSRDHWDDKGSHEGLPSLLGYSSCGAAERSLEKTLDGSVLEADEHDGKVTVKGKNLFCSGDGTFFPEGNQSVLAIADNVDQCIFSFPGRPAEATTALYALNMGCKLSSAIVLQIGCSRSFLQRLLMLQLIHQRQPQVSIAAAKLLLSILMQRAASALLLVQEGAFPICVAAACSLGSRNCKQTGKHRDESLGDGSCSNNRNIFTVRLPVGLSPEGAEFEMDTPNIKEELKDIAPFASRLWVCKLLAKLTETLNSFSLTVPRTALKNKCCCLCDDLLSSPQIPLPMEVPWGSSIRRAAKPSITCSCCSCGGNFFGTNLLCRLLPSPVANLIASGHYMTVAQIFEAAAKGLTTKTTWLIWSYALQKDSMSQLLTFIKSLQLREHSSEFLSTTASLRLESKRPSKISAVQKCTDAKVLYPELRTLLFVHGLYVKLLLDAMKIRWNSRLNQLDLALRRDDWQLNDLITFSTENVEHSNDVPSSFASRIPETQINFDTLHEGSKNADREFNSAYCNDGFFCGGICPFHSFWKEREEKDKTGFSVEKPKRASNMIRLVLWVMYEQFMMLGRSSSAHVLARRHRTSKRIVGFMNTLMDTLRIKRNQILDCQPCVNCCTEAVQRVSARCSCCGCSKNENETDAHIIQILQVQRMLILLHPMAFLRCSCPKKNDTDVGNLEHVSVCVMNTLLQLLEEVRVFFRKRDVFDVNVVLASMNLLHAIILLALGEVAASSVFGTDVCQIVARAAGTGDGIVFNFTKAKPGSFLKHIIMSGLIENVLEFIEFSSQTSTCDFVQLLKHMENCYITDKDCKNSLRNSQAFPRSFLPDECTETIDDGIDRNDNDVYLHSLNGSRHINYYSRSLLYENCRQELGVNGDDLGGENLFEDWIAVAPISMRNHILSCASGFTKERMRNGIQIDRRVHSLQLVCLRIVYTMMLHVGIIEQIISEGVDVNNSADSNDSDMNTCLECNKNCKTENKFGENHTFVGNDLELKTRRRSSRSMSWPVSCSSSRKRRRSNSFQSFTRGAVSADSALLINKGDLMKFKEQLFDESVQINKIPGINNMAGTLHENCLSPLKDRWLKIEAYISDLLVLHLQQRLYCASNFVRTENKGHMEGKTFDHNIRALCGCNLCGALILSSLILLLRENRNRLLLIDKGLNLILLLLLLQKPSMTSPELKHSTQQMPEIHENFSGVICSRNRLKREGNVSNIEEICGGNCLGIFWRQSLAQTLAASAGIPPRCCEPQPFSFFPQILLPNKVEVHEVHDNAVLKIRLLIPETCVNFAPAIRQVVQRFCRLLSEPLFLRMIPRLGDCRHCEEAWATVIVRCEESEYFDMTFSDGGCMWNPKQRNDLFSESDGPDAGECLVFAPTCMDTKTLHWFTSLLNNEDIQDCCLNWTQNERKALFGSCIRQLKKLTISSRESLTGRILSVNGRCSTPFIFGCNALVNLQTYPVDYSFIGGLYLHTLLPDGSDGQKLRKQLNVLAGSRYSCVFIISRFICKIADICTSDRFRMEKPKTIFTCQLHPRCKYVEGRKSAEVSIVYTVSSASDRLIYYLCNSISVLLRQRRIELQENALHDYADSCDMDKVTDIAGKSDDCQYYGQNIQSIRLVSLLFLLVVKAEDMLSDTHSEKFYPSDGFGNARGIYKPPVHAAASDAEFQTSERSNRFFIFEKLAKTLKDILLYANRKHLGQYELSGNKVFRSNLSTIAGICSRAILQPLLLSFGTQEDGCGCQLSGSLVKCHCADIKSSYGKCQRFGVLSSNSPAINSCINLNSAVIPPLRELLNLVVVLLQVEEPVPECATVRKNICDTGLPYILLLLLLRFSRCVTEISENASALLLPAVQIVYLLVEPPSTRPLQQLLRREEEKLISGKFGGSTSAENRTDADESVNGEIGMQVFEKSWGYGEGHQLLLMLFWIGGGMSAISSIKNAAMNATTSAIAALKTTACCSDGEKNLWAPCDTCTTTASAVGGSVVASVLQQGWLSHSDLRCNAPRVLDENVQWHFGGSCCCMAMRQQLEKLLLFALVHDEERSGYSRGVEALRRLANFVADYQMKILRKFCNGRRSNSSHFALSDSEIGMQTFLRSPAVLMQQLVEWREMTRSRVVQQEFLHCFKMTGVSCGLSCMQGSSSRSSTCCVSPKSAEELGHEVSTSAVALAASWQLRNEQMLSERHLPLMLKCGTTVLLRLHLHYRDIIPCFPVRNSVKVNQDEESALLLQIFAELENLPQCAHADDTLTASCADFCRTEAKCVRNQHARDSTVISAVDLQTHVSILLAPYRAVSILQKGLNFQNEEFLVSASDAAVELRRKELWLAVLLLLLHHDDTARFSEDLCRCSCQSNGNSKNQNNGRKQRRCCGESCVSGQFPCRTAAEYNEDDTDQISSLSNVASHTGWFDSNPSENAGAAADCVQPLEKCEDCKYNTKKAATILWKHLLKHLSFALFLDADLLRLLLMLIGTAAQSAEQKGLDGYIDRRYIFLGKPLEELLEANSEDVMVALAHAGLCASINSGRGREGNVAGMWLDTLDALFSLFTAVKGTQFGSMIGNQTNGVNTIDCDKEKLRQRHDWGYSGRSCSRRLSRLSIDDYSLDRITRTPGFGLPNRNINNCEKTESLHISEYDYGVRIRERKAAQIMAKAGTLLPLLLLVGGIYNCCSKSTTSSSWTPPSLENGSNNSLMKFDGHSGTECEEWQIAETEQTGEHGPMELQRLGIQVKAAAAALRICKLAPELQGELRRLLCISPNNHADAPFAINDNEHSNSVDTAAQAASSLFFAGESVSMSSCSLLIGLASRNSLCGLMQKEAREKLQKAFSSVHCRKIQ